MHLPQTVIVVVFRIALSFRNHLVQAPAFRSPQLFSSALGRKTSTVGRPGTSYRPFSTTSNSASIMLSIAVGLYLSLLSALSPLEVNNLTTKTPPSFRYSE